jgi:hypothetical protein
MTSKQNTARRLPDLPAKHRHPLKPSDVPDLAAFWNFQEPHGDRTAIAGEPYVLREAAGRVAAVAAPENPFGPLAAHIKEGQYLVCPRPASPLLDIHGPDQGLTVVAWLRRDPVSQTHCEFVAGQWNESNAGRQYGLFIDIRVWGYTDRVSGHVSHVGGPTPGYRYCIDCAIGSTPVEHGRWCCIAMTYDGLYAAAWLDGRLDANPEINPYPLAGGLHDGGLQGSDFTVGAVHRNGEMGNFFTGLVGGLAVYRRALTPAELLALANPNAHP